MRSRIPALIALALLLCALPGVRAFASAPCMPCCAEGAAASDCSMREAPCCEVAPAVPADAAPNGKLDGPTSALVDTQLAIAPAHGPIFVPPVKGAFAYTSPLRLSVVRRL